MSPMTNERWTAPATSLVVEHVLHGDGERVRLALHHHAQRIAHQDDVDPCLFHDTREQRIVRRRHRNLPSVALALLQVRDVITRARLS